MKVFYFCSINTPSYERECGQRLDVGAASGKVISIITALRKAHRRGYAISLPVLGVGSKVRFKRCIVRREGSAPVLFLSTFANRLIRRIAGALQYALFAYESVRQSDVVIIYNYSPEYIFALAVLALKRNRAFLDIEDGPILDFLSARELVNYFSFWLTKRLVRKSFFAASQGIMEKHGREFGCVLYGPGDGTAQRISPPVFSNSHLRVLYGGTIARDTGWKIFCDAIRTLRERRNHKDLQIEVLVTGFGITDEMAQVLRSADETERVRVQHLSNLTVNDYRTALESCSTALCLKIPESSIGRSTFPSKVVEITSSGRLLISTRVGDVSTIFSESSAILLEHSTGDCLAKALEWVASNPSVALKLAMAGQKVSEREFSGDVIVKRILMHIG